MIGIFKKNCIADNLEKIANKIFDNTVMYDLNLIEQWIGVLAYSFQIYFDFSAYSDMAIGLALMFVLYCLKTLILHIDQLQLLSFGKMAHYFVKIHQ